MGLEEASVIHQPGPWIARHLLPATSVRLRVCDLGPPRASKSASLHQDGRGRRRRSLSLSPRLLARHASSRKMLSRERRVQSASRSTTRAPRRASHATVAEASGPPTPLHLDGSCETAELPMLMLRLSMRRMGRLQLPHRFSLFCCVKKNRFTADSFMVDGGDIKGLHVYSIRTHSTPRRR